MTFDTGYNPEELDREIRRLQRDLSRREQALATLQDIQKGNSRLLGILLRDIEEEKRRSDGLLRNILPEDVITRMSNGETTIADTIDSATVVFSDFVGFSALSASMSAKQLVETLNEIYTEFDETAQRVGIEKIKTIGDAYLAVSGLDNNGCNHAEIAAEFALSIRDIIREKGKTFDGWRMRTGIHTGALTAGVIGTHKFAYDIWGDTVNIASRVQDAATANEVFVSFQTSQELDTKRFRLLDQDEVELKGRGLHTVYRIDWCR